MKCAYCLEEMNAGASVCRTCGRKQPISQATKHALIFGTVVVAVLGLGIYYSVVMAQRSNKIDRLAACAAFFGHTNIDRAAIVKHVETMSADSNLSWDDASCIEATFLGCPKVGCSK